ncbi:unnamed protein product [Caenorhabditis angaria]|uniref:C2H2-type domain-containing protein n=1 Tax=Caenorhabditis angaria TaxID=860376 RepID=A0A9P1MSR5_9PELO|nr:unnamed protein product [Caenorhabditis angaria]
MTDTEIITLSDDEDQEVQMVGVLPKNDVNQDYESTSATVLIQGGQQLNINDILPRSILETSQQVNHLRPSTSKIVKRVQRIPPPLPQNTRINRFRNNVDLGVRFQPLKRPVPLDRISSTYQFEAYEGSQPKRRSIRCLEAKRTKSGKFVCTYDRYTCHKVVKGSVEFINHCWQHVLTDSRRKSNEFVKSKGRTEVELRYANGNKKVDPPPDSFLKQLTTCQYCFASFKTVYLKQQHILSCHLNAHKPNSTCCNICERDFRSSSQLEVHLRTDHIVNDAPYQCKQCSYRTSIRLFFFDHYAEKHTEDGLVCPFCCRHYPFRPNQREREIMFTDDFVQHIKAHTHTDQYRCSSCALTFFDLTNLSRHRTHDHSPLGNHHVITQKKVTENQGKPLLPKKIEIQFLEKNYFKTLEGRRVEDEVACGSQMERLGCDNAIFGSKMYFCTCGDFQTHNGNRAASHFHRCGKTIKTGIREIQHKNMKIDESREVERKRSKMEIDDDYKEVEIIIDKTEIPPVSDYGLLKLQFPNGKLNELVEKLYKAYRNDS